jgi:hypothetical protein
MAEETANLETSTESTSEPSSALGESTPETPEVSQPPKPQNGDRVKEKGPKLSKFERAKQWKQGLARREAEISRKEALYAQREAEAAKPKRDYTLKDLTEARAAWESEGRFDLVEAADKEITKIKAEDAAQKAASVRTEQVPVMGTPEHKAEWEKAELELAQADPEFMREGTPLDTGLRALMAGPNGNIYRQHPRGIIAAYHAVKMELLQTENSKLKDELKRYRGLTSIGGGAPSRVGTGGRVESVGDFARLSLKDQRKHLLSGADKNGVPWF